jgi:dipeptidyl aminopeptidase/acylaminoacyl peptidase
MKFRIFALCLTLVASAVGQNSSIGENNDVIRPGDNLILQDIPPIPASLAHDISRYEQGRAAEIMAWHPLRREMLIATWFCNTPQVFQVNFPGAARNQVTFNNEDRSTQGVTYDPVKGTFFIFIRDHDGNQMFQIYRHDFDSGIETLLTDGKSKNSAGVWSSTGDRIVYGSTRRNGTDADLYVMNPRDPKTDRLLVKLEGNGWSAVDWSSDDQKILAVEEVSVNETYLWLIDVATGTKELLTPKSGQKAYYGEAHFNRTGKGLYVVTDRESEFRRLALFDPTTQRYHFVGQDRWDVVEFKPSRDGKWLATISNDDGKTTLHLLNAASGGEMPLKNLPAGEEIDIQWTKDSRYLGFSLDSARFPDDAYSLDINTGKVERWTHSETGGLNTDEFSEPRLVHWKGYDNLALSGYLYHPPARFRGKRPVIIDIHGGPEDQFQPYFLGPENYYLNELGVALVFPNIRGSTGYGKTFVKLDNGFSRENAYNDIGALLDWIKTQPDLDSDRVMVTGVSYGGNVALVTATRYPDRIRCAVDIDGPSDLVTFLEHTADWRRDLRRVEYGDERDPTMRAFLEQISPLKNAKKVTKPLLVVQGLNDPAVVPAEAERMISAVRENGAPVWYLAAKDEGHGFRKQNNVEFQFYVTVLFIQKFLLN